MVGNDHVSSWGGGRGSSRDHAPGTCAATPSGAASEEWARLLGDVLECLDGAKQFRSRLNGKIAWIAVLPPLGWFGRARRLGALYASVSGSIHSLHRQRRRLLMRLEAA